ncbi:hypothetical protein [Corynebacterium sp. A21]|uniref:hypothetical protein n=1 Tax=Corynebacterium sp. A21 TaxID=3457318 RepID=UPI003FD38F28
MATEIRGAVAKILSDQELVINKGTNDGIKEGDYVAVLPFAPETVEDPVSGDELGHLYRFKAALRVTQVSASLAIASTYKLRSVKVGGQGMGALGISFQPPKWIDEVESFDFDDSADVSDSQSSDALRVGDEFVVVPKRTADAGNML